MKRLLFTLSFIFLSCLFFYACGSQVYLVAEKAPYFQAIQSQYHFYIITPKDAKISDKKLIATLEQEMEKKGFNITKLPTTNDILVFLTTNSKLYQSSGTLFLPSQSRSSGYIGSTYYSGTQSYLQPMPYTTSSFNYQISINMYRLLANQELDHVWYGYLDVKAQDFDRAPNFYISKILDNFGQDKKIFEYWTPPLQ